MSLGSKDGFQVEFATVFLVVLLIFLLLKGSSRRLGHGRWCGATFEPVFHAALALRWPGRPRSRRFAMSWHEPQASWR